MASRAKNVEKIINGKNETISPITTPVGVKTKIEKGLSIMFMSIRKELTTPFLDKIGLNAKILMISDTIKGRIKSNITLCWATFLTLRLIKIAIGNPIKKAQITDIDECIIEDKKFSNIEEKKKFS